MRGGERLLEVMIFKNWNSPLLLVRESYDRTLRQLHVRNNDLFVQNFVEITENETNPFFQDCMHYPSQIIIDIQYSKPLLG